MTRTDVVAGYFHPVTLPLVYALICFTDRRKIFAQKTFLFSRILATSPLRALEGGARNTI